MGTWGSGSFENDDALDWVGAFVDDPEHHPIEDVFEAVNSRAGEYLEVPICAAAIAAAEIVAALHGTPNPKLPDTLKRWVRAQNAATDHEFARRALTAISHVESNSELKELWDDSPDAGNWYAELRNLQLRLRHPH